MGAALVLTLFFGGLHMVEQTADEQGRQQLETALRQAAVACYATEGIYPADVRDLQQRYGVQIDEDRYMVVYEVFAENLMPDITVLERE